MNKRNLLLLLFSLLSISCAAAPQEVQRRYFWPALPDTPKIEFVASYWSADDFPQTKRQQLIESVTGSESAPGFNKPWGIASDGEGKVYIVDTNLRSVLVFDLKGHTVSIMGEGKFDGLFFAPAGVALGSSGDIYVSDPKRNKVYSFTKDEKPLRTIGDDATLKWPVGMAVDDVLGRLYVANGRLHNIAVFDLEGSYLFSIGRRGGGDGEFNFPTDVDIDSKGNIVVADSMNARVQVFDHDGKLLHKFGQRGSRAEDFQIIKGIAVSREDNIFVTDGKGDKVLVFDSKGEPLTVLGGPEAVVNTMRLTPGGFSMPNDIAIDKNDAIFVVDSLNRRFQIFQIINEEWLKEHPIK